MKHKKRKELINFSEKASISFKEKNESLVNTGSRSLIKGLIGILSIVVFTVLLSKLYLSESSPNLSALPIIENIVHETILLSDFIIEFDLIDSTQKPPRGNFSDISIPDGARIIQYFHRAEDQYPFYLKIYADHRTLYDLNLEGNNYQLKKYLFEKEVKLSTRKWVLIDNMLDIITQDSLKTPFLKHELWQIESILSWSIGLRNLRKGDVISWVTEKHHYPLDGHVKEMGIVGLALKSQSLDTTLYAIKFSYLGTSPQYYDYSARPWERQFLSSPVKYGRISSRFNLTRLHPKLKEIQSHKGTDFAAPQGVEIYALADGEIIEMEHKSGNGNYVKLKHDEIYATAYLHMDNFNDSLIVGDQVKQGQLIGYVGSTGLSTGPHVCLRFWRRNIQRDFVGAFPFLPTSAPLPYKERKIFEKQRDEIIALTSKAIITEL